MFETNSLRKQKQEEDQRLTRIGLYILLGLFLALMVGCLALICWVV